MHTCIIKCALATFCTVVNAHLHYKVCTGRFIDGGWCTPDCNWCAVFFASGVHSTPSGVLYTLAMKTLPGVLGI